jgi:hypothetical protein
MRTPHKAANHLIDLAANDIRPAIASVEPFSFTWRIKTTSATGPRPRSGSPQWAYLFGPPSEDIVQPVRYRSRIRTR